MNKFALFSRLLLPHLKCQGEILATVTGGEGIVRDLGGKESMHDRTKRQTVCEGATKVGDVKLMREMGLEEAKTITLR